MEKELKIRLVKHSEISAKDLERIIKLKSQHWKYSFDSHRKWISENIFDNEYHLFIQNYNEKLIAYLNIVYVNVECDGEKIEHAGIGNVCVDKVFLGMNYGLLLMQIANFYLKKINKPGVLLCKEYLKKFYLKSGWIIFKGNTFINDHIYNDLLFLNYDPDFKILKLMRNF